jgi:methionyl-tRNA synthetase|tara:strand:- start:63 stop:266 length:204 start_codon:yes stop_codon:yes gene_type:complete
MATLTEITLQLIHKKLDEILIAIKELQIKDTVGAEHMEDVYERSKTSVTQEQFNSAMEEVMNLINKK